MDTLDPLTRWGFRGLTVAVFILGIVFQGIGKHPVPDFYYTAVDLFKLFW
ncbi:MAG TPA: hypothetical protein IAC43_09380 [Candidatus Faecivivens stercoripullorum]|uniref:Uncharacterized protein n=1 Tax=Candidatus Faecivivens stercoripullorum TaxID=2840805 RepID=A0A9D1H816_9FIRM|nr:hypothetical protein [Candidatus Faecivivens stercoripullorum]